MPGLVDDSEARKVSRQIDEALMVRNIPFRLGQTC